MASSGKRTRSESPHPKQKRPATRSSGEHYLIGFPSPLAGSKLPTVRQVLQYVLFIKSLSGKNESNMAHFNQAVEQVLLFWNMAGISTIKKQNAVRKLDIIWSTWNTLQKNRTRASDPGNKRQQFTQSLDKLWDIGSADAIEVIQANRFLTSEKKEEDIAFYLDQRGERVGQMVGLDKVVRSKVHQQQQRTDKQQQMTQSRSESPEFLVLEDSTSVSSQASSSILTGFPHIERTTSHSDYIMPNAPRRILDDQEVSQVFDRLKISHNSAAMIASAFIRACHGNTNDFVFSCSTSRRSRIANRYEISQNILESVSASPPKNVAVHWNGKLTTDRLGHKYEALAIIASGAPDFVEGKLLGVQQLANATGRSQAEATYDLLQLWNLTGNVRSLVFDTTSSNTGWKNGAAGILEAMLEKKVFYNACRHHIHELVIGCVSKSVFGKTTGPDNPLFNQFKAMWPNITKSVPITALRIPDGLQGKASDVESELKELLIKKKHLKAFIRGDYKECAMNSLALLNPAEKGAMLQPGATHHARWMGTLLYYQKMLMLSSQMQYDAKFVEDLQRINLFIVLFYIPMWLKASIGVDAPINDLCFLKDMLQLKSFEPDISEAAFQKLCSHAWYLQEETVIFALFTDNPAVSSEMKSQMADKLLHTDIPTQFRRGINRHRPTITTDTTLLDLIGPHSWFLFTALDLTQSLSWLHSPPTEWEGCESYNIAKEFVCAVKVVNDAAERGVKLNTDYAAILTDSQGQRASLLQVVEQHRRRFPDSKKATRATA